MAPVLLAPLLAKGVAAGQHQREIALVPDLRVASEWVVAFSGMLLSALRCSTHTFTALLAEAAHFAFPLIACIAM